MAPVRKLQKPPLTFTILHRQHINRTKCLVCCGPSHVRGRLPARACHAGVMPRVAHEANIMQRHNIDEGHHKSNTSNTCRVTAVLEPSGSTCHQANITTSDSSTNSCLPAENRTALLQAPRTVGHTGGGLQLAKHQQPLARWHAEASPLPD